MKEYLIITSIDNMTLDRKISKFTIMPFVDIYSDPKELHKLKYQGLVELLGSFSYSIFMQEGNILINRLNPNKYKGLTLKAVLDLYLIWLRDFFSTSWILEDNSFNCEYAYIFLIENKIVKSAYFNGLDGIPKKANFSIEKKTVDLNKMKLLAQNHDYIMDYLQTKNSLLFSFSLDKSIIRLSRAIKFITEARNQSDLAYRIMLFTCALECVFSTSTTELNYRLSERISFFAASNLNMRAILIFGICKNAYNVRSKLAHGDSLPDKEINKLIKLSINLDHLLRKVFQYILQNEEMKTLFESKNDKIDEYFNSLIFNR